MRGDARPVTRALDALRHLADGHVDLARFALDRARDGGENGEDEDDDDDDVDAVRDVLRKLLNDDDGGAIERVLAREWRGDDGGRVRDACVEGARRAAMVKMAKTYDRLLTAAAAARLATSEDDATRALEAMGWDVDRATGIARPRGDAASSEPIGRWSREDAVDVVETCARLTSRLDA